MDKFENRVWGTAQRYGLLRAGDRVLVAVSGGPDSVALLAALRSLSLIHSLHLSAAHVNHQLRGEESEQDEEFVRRLCRRLDIPLEVKHPRVHFSSKASRGNLEALAREERYEFFFQLVRQKDARVATGHTLNDQAETFLMKLCRGAGAGGLSGIYPLQRNPHPGAGKKPFAIVVRPLLETTRTQILNYLAGRKLAYRLDTSNEDLCFDRNWVRHQLVPLLAEKLNPKVLFNLGRTAGLLRETEEYLAEVGQQAFRQCRTEGEPELRLRLPLLRRLPLIVQREVVRQAVREYQSDLKGLTFSHVRDVLKLASGPSGREVHLPRRLKVRREFDDLCFTSTFDPLPFVYQLTIPGEIFVEEVAKRVVVRRIEVRPGQQKGVLLAFEGNFLLVRNRRPGDRYHTSSLSQKKLKKIFQERRVPRGLRNRLIVLESNQGIIWIEDLPLPPHRKPSKGAQQALEIEVIAGTL